MGWGGVSPHNIHGGVRGDIIPHAIGHQTKTFANQYEAFRPSIPFNRTNSSQRSRRSSIAQLLKNLQEPQRHPLDRLCPGPVEPLYPAVQSPTNRLIKEKQLRLATSHPRGQGSFFGSSPKTARPTPTKATTPGQVVGCSLDSATQLRSQSRTSNASDTEFGEELGTPNPSPTSAQQDYDP